MRKYIRVGKTKVVDILVVSSLFYARSLQTRQVTVKYTFVRYIDTQEGSHK